MMISNLIDSMQRKKKVWERGIIGFKVAELAFRSDDIHNGYIVREILSKRL